MIVNPTNMNVVYAAAWEKLIAQARSHFGTKNIRVRYGTNSTAEIEGDGVRGVRVTATYYAYHVTNTFTGTAYEFYVGRVWAMQKGDR